MNELFFYIHNPHVHLCACLLLIPPTRPEIVNALLTFANAWVHLRSYWHFVLLQTVW